MRKFFFLMLSVATIVSCSDGDLSIETIDFDSIAIDYCTAPSRTTANLLFKINEDQVLILELQSGVLNNGVVGETVITESAVPGRSQVTYRIFNDDVDDGYFCDNIPPADPVVTDEVVAEDGSVIITTIVNPDDSTQFLHTIQLSGISFITGSDERITNLTISEFGEVTTAIP
ncbi:hypothetical protein [Flagellimonas zhangzhouensis]|uniref:Uncharacterized protein n=1 Tax=Flagellimonas zhangzhouensis TaxID=1073328 RepID=A0A1H2R2V6_9FLAO|nr:hypothetical protein [Allomuricauda zhangzhouensis]SDQ58955.1 hypothetical protein SAMN05216294_1801 [Allomuricauda zhangzhouensis]SDW13470.1 hypothetical protein SAMN04487892_0452 [Allomuricauda zhangzhouensis]